RGAVGFGPREYLSPRMPLSSLYLPARKYVVTGRGGARIGSGRVRPRPRVPRQQAPRVRPRGGVGGAGDVRVPAPGGRYLVAPGDPGQRQRGGEGDVVAQRRRLGAEQCADERVRHEYLPWS